MSTEETRDDGDKNGHDGEVITFVKGLTKVDPNDFPYFRATYWVDAVKKLHARYGGSRRDLAASLGIGRTTVGGWLRGRVPQRLAQREILARAFKAYNIYLAPSRRVSAKTYNKNGWKMTPERRAVSIRILGEKPRPAPASKRAAMKTVAATEPQPKTNEDEIEVFGTKFTTAQVALDKVEEELEAAEEAYVEAQRLLAEVAKARYDRLKKKHGK